MRARRATILLCVLGALVLLLPLAAAARPHDAAVVKTRYNKKLKRKIIVTGAGLTLYMFTADANATPSCYDDETYHCSQLWHPYRSTDPPVAGPGVNASLLTTVARTDGDPEVMYNRHPLYTENGRSYSLKADTKPGQIRGQGYLQLWWVLSPQGKPIKKRPK
jgi:predicted lipoprotein with Yx(FWY)xxD motif